MELKLVPSPWVELFDDLVESSGRSALLACPDITRYWLDRISRGLTRSTVERLDLLTTFDPASMAGGSVDAEGLREFSKDVTHARVFHLARLHAKAYAADSEMAIVTSANLREAGLVDTREFGVLIEDAETASRISDHFQSFGTLGAALSTPELDLVASLGAEPARYARNEHPRLPRETVVRLDRALSSRADEALREIRASSGESTSSVFRRTILIALRDRPTASRGLHECIRSIPLDLCDDSIDRVIDGVHSSPFRKALEAPREERSAAPEAVRADQG
jgi:hypothetical protein